MAEARVITLNSGVGSAILCPCLRTRGHNLRLGGFSDMNGAMQTLRGAFAPMPSDFANWTIQKD